MIKIGTKKSAYKKSVMPLKTPLTKMQRKAMENRFGKKCYSRL